MTKYQTLSITEKNEVMTIALNNPPLNLFNAQLIEDIINVFRSLRTNTDVRIVVLTSTMDNFSAGIDLKEINDSNFTPESVRIQQIQGQEMMSLIENVEQVTIASLSGIVCGAGMAVAQVCDFRIMSEEAFFSVPETQVGTYYTWGCTPRLVRLVGASKAMEIIMTCDPITAKEAYRLNLANKVVAKKDLQKTTQEFAAKIASKSPHAIRITKKIALAATMQGLGNIFTTETELMQGVIYSGDTQKGIDAFLNKKKPDFE